VTMAAILASLLVLPIRIIYVSVASPNVSKASTSVLLLRVVVDGVVMLPSPMQTQLKGLFTRPISSRDFALSKVI
jgi:hypothetical protein